MEDGCAVMVPCTCAPHSHGPPRSPLRHRSRLAVPLNAVSRGAEGLKKPIQSRTKLVNGFQYLKAQSQIQCLVNISTQMVMTTAESDDTEEEEEGGGRRRMGVREKWGRGRKRRKVMGSESGEPAVSKGVQ